MFGARDIKLILPKSFQTLHLRKLELSREKKNPTLLTWRSAGTTKLISTNRVGYTSVLKLK